MTSMADILALAAQSRGRDRDDDDEMEAPKPLPEAVIADLRSKFDLYGKQRFAPGDLVTPAKNSDMKGAGEPHIVLEVRSLPEPLFSDAVRPGSNSYGVRLDMRIATRIPSGEIVAGWVESYQFEPYTGEGA